MYLRAYKININYLHHIKLCFVLKCLYWGIETTTYSAAAQQATINQLSLQGLSLQCQCLFNIKPALFRILCFTHDHFGLK